MPQFLDEKGKSYWSDKRGHPNHRMMALSGPNVEEHVEEMRKKGASEEEIAAARKGETVEELNARLARETPEANPDNNEEGKEGTKDYGLELESIHIKNYRSIKSEQILIEEIDGKKCFLMFGKNEVGKSNFLKAIALLNPEQPVTYDTDCFKEAMKKEEPISIRYFFRANGRLIDFPENEICPDKIKDNISRLEINLTIEKNNSRNQEFILGYKDLSILKRFLFDETTGRIVNITKEIEHLYPEGLKEEKANEIILTHFKEWIEKQVPKIIYWEPTEKHLITNDIDLNQFMQNPEQTSLPLRNIFNLIGVPDKNIPSYVQNFLNTSDNQDDFEVEASQIITKHINQLWAEHNVEIKLKVNKPQLSVHVKDKLTEGSKAFNMRQRSEGFKQFVSILLNLSIESRKGNLENALILLDEPELHLHPSGIRDLKKELLEISKKNVVILASHSIHLVDKINLDRNKTVVKEGVETKIGNEDSCSSEEVVYQALGTSTAEITKSWRLLFEGESDIEAFKLFVKKFEEELRPPAMGLELAKKAKNMLMYWKIFKSQHVKVFILVDSDKGGKSVKERFKLEKIDDEGRILEIKDIVQSEKQRLTLEDLLPKKVIKQAVQKTYGKEISLDDKKPIIDQLNEFKERESLQNKNVELKTNIIEIVSEDVKDEEKDQLKKKYGIYYEYVEELIQKIKSIEENK